VTKKKEGKKKPLSAFPRPLKKAHQFFSLLLIASVWPLTASVLPLTAPVLSCSSEAFFSSVSLSFLPFNFAFLGCCCAGNLISDICLGEFLVEN